MINVALLETVNYRKRKIVIPKKLISKTIAYLKILITNIFYRNTTKHTNIIENILSLNSALCK